MRSVSRFIGCLGLIYVRIFQGKSQAYTGSSAANFYVFGAAGTVVGLVVFHMNVMPGSSRSLDIDLHDCGVVIKVCAVARPHVGASDRVSLYSLSSLVPVHLFFCVADRQAVPQGLPDGFSIRFEAFCRWKTGVAFIGGGVPVHLHDRHARGAENCNGELGVVGGHNPDCSDGVEPYA